MKNSSFYAPLWIFSMLLICSCSEQETEPVSEWLIPIDEVFDGGPGKDGIPSVDNPNFSLPSDIAFMRDDDLVTVVESNDEVVAYPHPVMDWHEIVNDSPGALPLAITYCPLTGTSIAWERTIDGRETTFGVSGLLYNTNLMPYDRASNSTWSQMRQDCVNGDLINTKARQYPLIELSWSTYKTHFPEASVVNTNTGISRNYGVYPYGDYKTNNDRLLFPVSKEDDRVPQKERVLGVLNGNQVKTYRFSQFSPSGGLKADLAFGMNIIVVGSSDLNYMVAFEVDSSESYEFIPDAFPTIIRDEVGNEYDVFGRIVSGSGNDLQEARSYIGFWFSFPAFFETVEVYE